MDFLDIVMELRKQHGIDVPEAEYRELESLDSSANYLLPKFQRLRLPEPSLFSIGQLFFVPIISGKQ